MSYARIAAIAAVLVAVFGAGWTANGWRKDTALSDLHAVHTGLIAAANATTIAAMKAEQEKQAKRVAEAARIDAEETARLNEAQNEIQTLRDAVARGTRGLRIAATCPARPADVPGTASAPGVGDGAGARLTGAAEQDYFALRSEISTTLGQLATCQKLITRSPTP